MKILATIRDFFISWSRKKTMVLSGVGLCALAVGLTVWAIYPSFKTDDSKPSKEVTNDVNVAYKDVTVIASSLEKDISINFVNEKGNVLGQDFAVKLVRTGDGSEETSNGSTVTEYASDEELTEKKSSYEDRLHEYQAKLDEVDGIVLKDDNHDGVIYQKDLEPGQYDIWYVPVDGFFPKNTVVAASVKDKAVYKIDTNVTKKVKEYSAAQDTNKNHNVSEEAKVIDTVPLLDSKKEIVARSSQAVDPYAGVDDKSVVDVATILRDSAGHELYITENVTNGAKATVADYQADRLYYYPETIYTGWQNIDGNTYYYNEAHVPVTGKQTIGGVTYIFNPDGTLSEAKGAGIDVSKWNGNIDWNRVRASGINYVYIRCGLRGSGGSLSMDPKFIANVNGAKAAGLKVGLYFYSNATNTAEAVEEASLAVSYARQVGGVNLPIYMDVEGPRMPLSNKPLLTSICKAFCETVRSAGYQTGVYASISLWVNKLDYSVLSAYNIWIARYNSVLSDGKYNWSGKKVNVWQYSETGNVDGISGHTDLDFAY